MTTILDELKKLLGPNYKPPQVFKEHCAKLARDRKRGKLKRRVANRLTKMERMRQRAAGRRRRKRTRQGGS